MPLQLRNRCSYARVWSLCDHASSVSLASSIFFSQVPSSQVPTIFPCQHVQKWRQANNALHIKTEKRNHKNNFPATSNSALWHHRQAPQNVSKCYLSSHCALGEVMRVIATVLATPLSSRDIGPLPHKFMQIWLKGTLNTNIMLSPDWYTYTIPNGLIKQEWTQKPMIVGFATWHSCTSCPWHHGL